MDMSSADMHLVWLMLFAAEHGSTAGGIVGAAACSVAIGLVSQLLGVLGPVPLAAGIIGTAVAATIPHGCYAIATLFGVACLAAPRTTAVQPKRTDPVSTLLESGYSLDECPPRFCF